MGNRNEQLFLTALRGLRNTLAAAVDQIDTILDLAERPASSEASKECVHPAAYRTPTPSMGHPDRFYCRACKKEVEG